MENNPNSIFIPRLHEAFHGTFDESPEFFVVAMDFIDGVSAKSMAYEAKVGLYEFATKAILHDSGRGLAALHAQNIAHCDVKADNVMIARDGKSFLCDFGISLWEEDMRGSNLPRKGTPSHMAPEICDVYARVKYSTKVDTWAFGIMAFELSLGQIPGEERARYNKDILMRHTAMCLPPAFPDNKGFSKDYSMFVSGCLVKDPAWRPSMRELLNASVMDLRFPDLNRRDLAGLINHPDNLFLLPEP